MSNNHPLGPELPPGTTATHVAREIGVSVNTLKSWVYRELLPPPEGSKKYPVWHEGHIQWGRDLRKATEDMTLSEFRDMAAEVREFIRGRKAQEG